MFRPLSGFIKILKVIQTFLSKRQAASQEVNMTALCQKPKDAHNKSN